MESTISNKRLVSLDLFRGITIAGMLLVNNPGSWEYLYKPLEHAEWTGWTPTDLVFPFFLFIVGVAIMFSLDKYLQSNQNMFKLYFRIIRRTVFLFVLGMFLNGFPKFNLATIRIPGVLQRIAVCYLMSSLIYLILVRRKDNKLTLSISGMVWITLGLIGVYYFIMRFIPVPGYGTGLINSKEGNLAAYVDRAVFGSHLWQYSKTWDPEGLLSTIPSIATTLTGIICGWWLKKDVDSNKKLAMLFVVGSICIVGGYVLQIISPISKNLWSGTYVIFTTGMALNFLGICYWYTDIKGHTWGSKPFLILGTNAIAVYVLSQLAEILSYEIQFNVKGNMLALKPWLFQYIYSPLFGNFFGSLMSAIAFVITWMLIMYILYKKKIFIKI